MKKISAAAAQRIEKRLAPTTCWGGDSATVRLGTTLAATSLTNKKRR